MRISDIITEKHHKRRKKHHYEATGARYGFGLPCPLCGGYHDEDEAQGAAEGTEDAGGDAD